MSKRRFIRFWACLTVAVAAAAASGQAAWAAALSVAGANGRLWIVVPVPHADAAADDAAGSITVLTHGPGGGADQLLKVRTLRGQVDRGAVAAGGDSLWIAYSDGTVQRIDPSPAPIEPGWTFTAQIEASLPEGGELRSLAAGPGGPWALMRLPTAWSALPGQEGGGGPAQPLPQDEVLRSILLGLPPGVPTGQEDSAAGHEAESTDAPPPAPTGAEADADADADAASAGDPPAGEPSEPEEGDPNDPDLPRRDYLLELRGGQWRPVTLPDDWPHGAPASLVMGVTPARPILLARPRGDDQALHAYRWDGRHWQRTLYNLPDSAALPGSAVAVQGQLVVSRLMAHADPVRVAVTVLRRGEARPIGELAIDAPPGSAWGMAPMGLSVALVVREPAVEGAEPAVDESPAGAAAPLGLHWAKRGLTGEVVQPPAPLALWAPSPWTNAVDYVVIAAIGLLSALMLVVFWQRDPARNQLDLPAELALADLPRRGLAGLIDLLPGLLIVMAVYEVGAFELLRHHWPGSVPSFEGTVPGLLVIGVFVAHTTASELVTRRTLGKALLGMRVADLKGQPPRAWQLLVRGVLKAFDLVAWLLLVLPMLGPYRQRLGDLLARTVVVTPRGEDDDPTEDEDRADEP